jgi:hypothetical protein
MVKSNQCSYQIIVIHFDFHFVDNVYTAVRVLNHFLCFPMRSVAMTFLSSVCFARPMVSFGFKYLTSIARTPAGLF